MKTLLLLPLLACSMLAESFTHIVSLPPKPVERTHVCTFQQLRPTIGYLTNVYIKTEHIHAGSITTTERSLRGLACREWVGNGAVNIPVTIPPLDTARLTVIYEFDTRKHAAKLRRVGR